MEIVSKPSMFDNMGNCKVLHENKVDFVKPHCAHLLIEFERHLGGKYILENKYIWSRQYVLEPSPRVNRRGLWKKNLPLEIIWWITFPWYILSLKLHYNNINEFFSVHHWHGFILDYYQIQRKKSCQELYANVNSLVVWFYLTYFSHHD